MRKTTMAVLGLLCLTVISGDSEAGLFRQRTRETYRYSARGRVYSNPAPVYSTPQQSCPTGGCPRATTAPTRPLSMAPSAEAGTFLARLNAWRAAHGRGPVGWSDQLAARAATNTAQHAPHSMAGSGQCWAGTTSLTQSLEMWKASPPHAHILLSARSAVGASPCPSGATCNAM